MRTSLLGLVLIAFASAALAHPPVSVVIDARGNVYYSDLDQVWRVAPDGTKSVAVPNVHTHELYLDAQGNLFGEHLWYEGERTDKWGHYVWKRDAAGRVSMVKPRTEGLLTNYSFVRDAAGNMYWAQFDKGEIRKRAPDGAVTRVVGELKAMRWLHVTPAGTLYVVDGSDLVRVRDRRAVRLARSITTAQRHTVMGIWTDRAENVYLADHANRAVKRVTPDGRVSTVATSSFPWSPTGGAFAANGDLWILEASVTNQVRVRRIGARTAR
jgi:sugar lactone lactonase YvrE